MRQVYDVAVRWVALLMLVACGRVGFDARGVGASDASLDDAALGDATMTDGMFTQDDCTEPGLLLYLAFDETDGAIALDSSGNGYHGALEGFTATTRVPGKKGNALHFDGVDDSVVIGEPDALDDIGAMTTCAWVLRDAEGTTYETIIDKSFDGYSEGWNFYLRPDGGPGFYTNYDAYAEVGPVPLGDWRFVCGSWDGASGSTGIRLYRDAVSPLVVRLGLGMAFASDAAHPMTIGRGAAGGYELFGTLDEVRIYDHVLSEPAIAALFACTQAP